MNWLINAAERIGGCAEGRPKIPAGTSLDQAYALVARAYGIEESALAASVAALFRLQPAVLDAAEPEAIRIVPEKLARRYRLLPLHETHDEIVVATSDPTHHDAERAVEFIACRRVVMQVASPIELAAAIEASYAPARVIDTLLQSMNADLSTRDAAATPVARLTQLILDAAVAAHASEVHVEPGRHQGIVRFRVNGAMRPFMRMPLGTGACVVSHVKALAALDVADRLRPQHGVARFAVAGRAIDLCVSTSHARDTERLMIRVLDPEAPSASDAPCEGHAADDAPARQRILLVHDDAAMRSVVATLLGSSGYCVEIADDGAAALDRLGRDADFALVALDLAMRGADGLDVLRRVRAAPATAGLPVIVLTADAGDAAESSVMRHGADDYVRHPLDPARFVARVRAVLRRAAA
jgi:CheY-like chemotaxis protein